MSAASHSSPSPCSYGLSNVEEALRKFQAGELPDAEWYRIVAPSVREVLDKKEVQRQSILFEIIKSEKDYVADLELVKEVSPSVR